MCWSSLSLSIRSWVWRNMRRTSAMPRTLWEGWLLIRVLGVMIALRFLLPLLKLRTLLRCLKPHRIPSDADHARFDKAVLYTDILLWRHPFPLSGQCLPRALLLYYFATRFGLPVQFHCGVYRTGRALGGHAWISLKGEPYKETTNPEEYYAVTFSFPTCTQHLDRANVVKM